MKAEGGSNYYRLLKGLKSGVLVYVSWSSDKFTRYLQVIAYNIKLRFILMADKQPSRRLLQLAITDAVRTRLISKSAFKDELEKPRKSHLNKGDNEHQSMTNLLPQEMIDLMKRIDEGKKQDYKYNSTCQEPYIQRHAVELDYEDAFNKKIRYSHLDKKQNFNFEGSRWNNTKLVTTHTCCEKLNTRSIEDKNGTEISNFTLMNLDSAVNSYENNSNSEFPDCGYTNYDCQIFPVSYGARETCSTSKSNINSNLSTESLLTNKNVHYVKKNQPDCNEFMSSVADKIPCRLIKKPGSSLSFSSTNYGKEAYHFLNSHSLCLSNNKEPNAALTDYKNVSSEEFQNFKACTDKISCLSSESNFQSIPNDSMINSSFMMKKSEFHSTNNQSTVDITKQSDSLLTTCNSHFNHLSNLDYANKHFDTNSDVFVENESFDCNSCSCVSQYSMDDFGKDNIPFSKKSALEIFTNNSNDMHCRNSILPKSSLSTEIHSSYNSNVDFNSIVKNQFLKNTAFDTDLDTKSLDYINVPCSFEYNQETFLANERNMSQELNQSFYSDGFSHEESKNKSDFNLENLYNMQCSNSEIWQLKNYSDSAYFTLSDDLSPSGSDIEISNGKNETSRSFHSLSSISDSDIELPYKINEHKKLINIENNKFGPFFEKQYGEIFESDFKCLSFGDISKSDSATAKSSFLSSPKTNVSEGTNIHQACNDRESADEVKANGNISYSMKNLIDFDYNSKVPPQMNHSEFPIKISTYMLCLKPDVETSLSKEVAKCKIFKNDGSLKSDELYLYKKLKRSVSDNSEFLNKLQGWNMNSESQYTSQDKLCVSFDDSEVKSTKPFPPYNTEGYPFYNLSLDHEPNSGQHCRHDGFIESSDIVKYVSSECESDYINDLINELM
ncbi:hypothetical protein NPIL_332561 [Nephila pilipes]|uniref:Uncharacterized protein n=1 Tax=Nephila pilipes TaxID=299642 RepID=A0A8X6QW39_NEPPI|nr:hypothetical protein NPIL_332561 [Nephila pilipes]